MMPYVGGLTSGGKIVVTSRKVLEGKPIGMFNQAKLVMKAKKLQKELANEIIEVEAGDGAVTVQINGEQKVKKITIDPDYVDLDDIVELERWVEAAVKEAISKSQQLAAEKMKPLLGAGGLGL